MSEALIYAGDTLSGFFFIAISGMGRVYLS